MKLISFFIILNFLKVGTSISKTSIGFASYLVVTLLLFLLSYLGLSISGKSFLLGVSWSVNLMILSSSLLLIISFLGVFLIIPLIGDSLFSFSLIGVLLVSFSY